MNGMKNANSLMLSEKFHFRNIFLKKKKKKYISQSRIKFLNLNSWKALTFFSGGRNSILNIQPPAGAEQ